MSARPVPAEHKHREGKPEALVNIPGQKLPHVFSQSMQQSAGVTAGKAALTSRPIAPAPVQQANQVAAPVPLNITGATPQVVSSAPTGSIKIPLGLGITPDARTIPQQVAVNLSAQVAAMTSASFSVTQTGPAMQSVAITAGSSLHLSGGNLVQPQLSQKVPMASLIRSSIPASLQTSGQISAIATTQTNVTQTASVAPSPLVHAYSSHVPRGPAAASALTGPRGSAVATPIMRPPTQATAMQIPATSTTAGQHISSVHQIQPRMLHVRPTTPPMTRANSPATQADPHRVGGAPAVSTSAVQITIQHPREVASRPIHAAGSLSNPSLPKQAVGFTPSAVPPAHLVQSQKLVMSQGTVQSPSPAGAVVNVAAPRPGRTIGQTTVALNLTQPATVPRTQKILATQVTAATSATTPTTPGNLPQGQMFGLSRPQGMQKVIVSHTTVPATVQTGSVITTVAKAVPGASALNLSQAIPRQPKMVSHVAAASTSPAVPITTITKTAAKVQPQRVLHTGHTIVTDGAGGVRDSSTVSTSQSTPGSVFQSQTQRNSATVVVSTAASAPSSHTDTRQSADRPNFPPTAIPYTLPLEYNTYYNPTLMNYTSLMYQQVAAAAAAQQQQQALTSISSGTVRPFSKQAVPGQPATLPSASQGTKVTTPTTPTVSLASVMMAVDPARQAAGATTQPTMVSSTDAKVLHAAAEGGGGGISVALTAVAAAAAAAANQNAAASGHPPRQSSPGVTGSPRPSILRKRPTDGVAVVKKNLLGSMTSAEAASSSEAISASVTHPHAVSPRSAIHDPSRENSQSSTDTASSAESTPTAPGIDIKIKQEPPDGVENGTASAGALSISGTNSTEATPRKKPRKQFLHTNDDYQGADSEEEEIKKFSINVNLKRELEKAAEEVKKEDLEEYYDEEGVRWVKERKRPPVSLLNHYACTWKARHNHFTRYSEVKPKEERRPTVNELANMKGVHQKTSGWKMYHMSAQLEQLMDMERDVQEKLLGIQEAIAPKHIAKHPTMEDDIGMVHELSQGNIQRCRLLVDQLEESRQAVMKVLDHKKRIVEIINKHHSKRPVKKKERT